VKRLTALLAVVLVLLASCRSSAPSRLDFTAKTLEGADFTGESLAGKPAALWFWSPWCTYCQADADLVNRVVESYAGKIAFVGVACRDELSAMTQFVADYKMGGFPHIADLDSALYKKYRVTGTPTLLLFGADGRRRDVIYGSITEDEMTEAIGKLVDGE
jgi:thiol-disulfide isomerase/thioredoxin